MTKMMISLMAAVLTVSAGSYATLKNGKTIILHENGTWEEVSVAAPSAPTVTPAIQPVLTQPSPAVLAPAVVTVAPTLASEPLARQLVGVWKSSDQALAYEFRNDGSVTYTIDGASSTQPYNIKMLDTNDGAVTVTIGDAGTYGKITFGGLQRKFIIAKDGKTMTDITDEMTTFVTVKLKKY